MLEVNRGWFERYGVEPGSRIEGLPVLLSSLAPSKATELNAGAPIPSLTGRAGIGYRNTQ
jgi:hypothetical protein